MRVVSFRVLKLVALNQIDEMKLALSVDEDFGNRMWGSKSPLKASLFTSCRRM